MRLFIYNELGDERALALMCNFAVRTDLTTWRDLESVHATGVAGNWTASPCMQTLMRAFLQWR